MKTKRDTELAVLEVLKTETDENHILSNREIIEKVNEIYGFEMERRTLSSMINSLIEMGYDISVYNENGKGYYLRDREFTKGEVLMLCNAIHGSNLMPLPESKRVISTLLDTQSKYMKDDFRKNIFIENMDKKNNKEFFNNFEIISKAIKEKKNIIFNYTKYDEKLNLVNKREEPYVVSPIYLAAKNGTAYMASKSEHHEGFAHYRLDRMQNVKETDGKYLRASRNEDPYSYFKSQTNMFAGDNISVDLKINRNMIDTVVDDFGKNISLRTDKEDKDKMLITVKATEQGMILYALKYADCMEIVSPESLRNKVKIKLEEALKKYK